MPALLGIAKEGLLEITLKCTMANGINISKAKMKTTILTPYASTALAPRGLGAVVFEHVVPHSKTHWRAKLFLVSR